MKVDLYIIEVAKGYIAEMSLPKSWTIYSKVYPTRERTLEESEALCNKSGWQIREVHHDNVEDNEAEIPN